MAYNHSSHVRYQDFQASDDSHHAIHLVSVGLADVDTNLSHNRRLDNFLPTLISSIPSLRTRIF